MSASGYPGEKESTNITKYADGSVSWGPGEPVQKKSSLLKALDIASYLVAPILPIVTAGSIFVQRSRYLSKTYGNNIPSRAAANNYIPSIAGIVTCLALTPYLNNLGSEPMPIQRQEEIIREEIKPWLSRPYEQVNKEFAELTPQYSSTNFISLVPFWKHLFTGEPSRVVESKTFKGTFYDGDVKYDLTTEDLPVSTCLDDIAELTCSSKESTLYVTRWFLDISGWETSAKSFQRANQEKDEFFAALEAEHR
jgi:hypothetical protein